jgi:hypothetical protein
VGAPLIHFRLGRLICRHRQASVPSFWTRACRCFPSFSWRPLTSKEPDACHGRPLIEGNKKDKKRPVCTSYSAPCCSLHPGRRPSCRALKLWTAVFFVCRNSPRRHTVVEAPSSTATSFGKGSWRNPARSLVALSTCSRRRLRADSSLGGHINLFISHAWYANLYFFRSISCTPACISRTTSCAYTKHLNECVGEHTPL